LDRDSILRELSENAKRVDSFIFQILEEKRPDELYQASKHLIKAGGKRLRPYLVIKSSELVGGKLEDALPFAAALEILHNFTLIHDDVMDNDDTRRGSPTVHTKWNNPIAICAGDLLFAKAFEAITAHAPVNLDRDRLISSIERIARSTVMICEGQVLDMTFPEHDEVTEEDYLLMVGGKTAALFRACAEGGALIGGGEPGQVNALGEFAWNAGIAFQLIDDVLGAIGDEATLGKPIGSDLREGKKTLIIIHALDKADPDAKMIIKDTLGDEEAEEGEIERVNEILRKTGSIDYVMRKAQEYTGRAKKHLEPFPQMKAKRDLLDLIDLFVGRTF
jgi:geranylgeranyl diphosphate synthase type I